ncbi:MAG: cobalt ECF transporter T component CbiQ [Gemmataceae bacterium]
MTVSLKLPSLPPTRLKNWDSRWKLIGVVLAASVSATLQHFGPAFLALALSLLLLGLARISWRWYLVRVSVLWPVWIGLVLLLPFFVDEGGPAYELGSLRLSLDGFLVAGRVSACATATLTVVLFLIVTTPIPVLLQAAHALRIPSILVQLVSLTYRYFFLLADEIQRLRIALRIRGYRSKPNAHTYRTVGYVTGLLLVRSAERAERVGQAMRCRGYGNRFPAIVEFRTTWRDVLLFLAIMSVSGGLLIWDRLL